MRISRLVWQEIWHRKLTFLLALMAIATAVGYAVNAIASIQIQRRQTQKEIQARDDKIRKITKDMGFNINILPADLNLGEFLANDFAQQTMPYEFVQRIADSRLVKTINHLRPALIQKVHWQEQNRDVILMGVSGVIPWTHRTSKKRPLSEPVNKDGIHLGNVIAKDLNLKQGDTTTMNGVEFEVHKIYQSRGNKDDITCWIDLQVAQDMVGMQDRINMIQALQCNCASIDRMAEIESEISKVLGEKVQIIELSTTAIARAKSRVTIANDGKATLAREKKNASIEIAVLSIAGTILMGILSWWNVQQRRSEIGILRAIGTSTGKILAIFVSKAILVGVIGALVGCGVGVVTTIIGSGEAFLEVIQRPVPVVLGVMIVIAPLVSLIASWIPASIAAAQDAAQVLAEE